ncbi:hypothetical protein [Asticcacaulis sp. AND118]|uniref:hypothetical protein n=1 Tax=Asticcacaulis sp. AND118 TaxID=2840468 RepID=UPI001CFFB278|nr:hypothetical protein [Asticcacaulis sp. AND118]UDF04147.1 hypothetical protein LH365_03645 [Asticcacaulis sp. AND118]
MKSVVVGLVGSLVAGCAMAEPLASCGDEKGMAYYVTAGRVTPDAGGWQEDAITGGSVTLDFSAANGLDVLFYDAKKTIQSAKGGGAEVKPIALGEKNISVLVSYKGNTAEIYDFYENDLGIQEFAHLVLKPANTLVPKAAVYVGQCKFFDLTLLNNYLNKNK